MVRGWEVEREGREAWIRRADRFPFFPGEKVSCEKRELPSFFSLRTSASSSSRRKGGGGRGRGERWGEGTRRTEGTSSPRLRAAVSGRPPRRNFFVLAGYTLISARFGGKVAHGSRQPFTTASPSSTRLERDPRGDPFRFRLFPNQDRTQTPPSRLSSSMPDETLVQDRLRIPSSLRSSVFLLFLSFCLSFSFSLSFCLSLSFFISVFLCLFLSLFLSVFLSLFFRRRFVFF